MALGRPGARVEGGDGRCFELVEPVGSGGEGETWRAVSELQPGERLHWAVKILHPRHQDIRHWHRLWQASMQRIHQHRLPFLMPCEVFIGPPPFLGSEPRSGRQVAYLVSRWVEGALDLERWCDGRPTLEERCGVLDQLCDAVDQLGAAGLVHCDLSVRNVLLERGQATLIDLTFLVPAGSPPSLLRGTPGFAAPEAGRGGKVDLAQDRYSVGAIGYFLLTGSVPPKSGHDLRHVLKSLGHVGGLADRVLALLDHDPAARPERLRDWSDDIRRLAFAGASADRYLDLGAQADGGHAVHTVVAGPAVTLGTVVTPRRSPSLESLGADAPGAVRCVALARRGNGDVAVFAGGGDGTLTVRIGSRWQRVDCAPVAGRIVATPAGTGAVHGFATADDGTLVEVTVALDGRVAVQRLPGPPVTLLAAAAGRGGVPVLTVAGRDGRVLGGPAERLEILKLADVDTVAVAVNQFDEPVYVAGRDGANYLHWIGPDGELETLPVEGGVRDVAMLWLRTGPLVAVAADSGVWCASGRLDRWQRICQERARRVTLTVGGGWLVHLAALTTTGLFYAAELHPDEWFPWT